MTRGIIFALLILILVSAAWAGTPPGLLGMDLVASGKVVDADYARHRFAVLTDEGVTYGIYPGNAIIGRFGKMGVTNLHVGNRVEVYGTMNSGGRIRPTYVSIVGVKDEPNCIPAAAIDDAPAKSEDSEITVELLQFQTPIDQDLRADRADASLAGTVRSVSGSEPNYRIVVRVGGDDFEVRTNRQTVFAGGQRGQLRVGNRVRVEGALDANCVITARTLSSSVTPGRQEATIRQINRSARTLDLTDSQGARITVFVPRDAEIVRDRRQLDFGDLQIGDRIRVSTYQDQNGRLTADRIEVITSGRRGEVISGRITRIDERAGYLWVEEGGRSYRVDVRDADILRDGSTIRLRDIREGDTARVFGDFSDSTVIAARIQVVTGRTGAFSAEGTVESIDPQGRFFTLQSRVIFPIRIRVNTTRGTAFVVNSRSGRLEDLRVGDRVTVEGNLRGLSSIDASRVTLR